MSKAVWAAVFAMGLAACASEPPPPPPTVVQLEFKAGADLNATPDGRGAPARVRILELKNAGVFQQAGFFALYDQAQGTLGADLVAQDEALLTPGQSLSRSRTLDGDTRQLGIMVAFRDIDNASWRQVIEVVPAATTRYTVEVGARAVSVHPVQ
ncbi:MAG: type VI secretion system lipoprotein TssJ [Gammaproteobacteria bacterium]|nr:type VI secretion system lipoprotein TssJ [Gammaproteobacteria bacterium]